MEGRLDKCTNYHHTPHPASEMTEAIYLPKNLLVTKPLPENFAIKTLEPDVIKSMKITSSIYKKAQI